MIQETQDSRQHLQAQHWQARVSHFLQQRAAVRISEVADWLGMEEKLVRHCLAEFEQTGAVEILRPIGCSPTSQTDLDYYRWRHSTDRQYFWQAELCRRRPMTLRDLRLTLRAAV